MSQWFPPSVLAALGLGLIGLGCKPEAASGVCAPFPPPATTSGAACIPLAPRTVLRDLGNSEPCGGYGAACMVVDDTAIYFTASSGTPTPVLFRMPKTGGSVHILDEGVSAPISLDGASLVYTRVTSRPQSGGVGFDYPNVVRLDSECSAEALPTGGWDDVQSPTVDLAGGISWLASSAASASMAVMHWDRTTNQTDKILDLPGTASFVGHADALYWLDWSSATDVSTLLTMPSVGGTPRTVTTIPRASAITDVDDDSLYVLTVLDLAARTYALVRVSKADGTVTTVAEGAYLPIAGSGSYVGYVVHDTNAYWAEGGRVRRAPKTGGPSEVVFDLGEASSKVVSIAFDACNLYVARQAGATYEILGQGLPSATPPSPPDASASPGRSHPDSGDASASSGDASTLDTDRVLP